MNHTLTLRAVILAGLLSLAHTVKADDPSSAPPNYMGASIGSVSSTTFCTDLIDCAETGRSWKAYSGVRVTDKILMEGGYVQFGEQQGSDGTNTVKSSLNGYTTAGVVTYPLDQLELFGKAGMWWWKDETKTGSNTVKADGSDLFYGAGANYNLGGNMGVRAEWERFETSKQANTKQSTDLISVGVTFSSL